MDGWVKLYRKTQGSQMYKALNSKQRDVMTQCLLLANHSEREWGWGTEVFRCSPGQFITSLESIRKKCAKDVFTQNVRTALLRLERWGFLTNKSTKTGRLITICNWDKYQDDNIPSNNGINQQLTKSQQTANKQLTTNKNDKNIKNDKNDKNISFEIFWNLYDKKVGDKTKLAKKWNKLTDKERESIIDYIPKYIRSQPDKKYRKHPDTFFNNKSWQDEIINDKPVKNLQERVPANIV